MELKKISVIGAGTMGNGITQVFAQNGHEVTMIDVKDEYVKRGVETIKKSLGRLVKKEKITE